MGLPTEIIFIVEVKHATHIKHISCSLLMLVKCTIVCCFFKNKNILMKVHRPTADFACFHVECFQMDFIPTWPPFRGAGLTVHGTVDWSNFLEWQLRELFAKSSRLLTVARRRVYFHCIIMRSQIWKVEKAVCLVGLCICLFVRI